MVSHCALVKTVTFLLGMCSCKRTAGFFFLQEAPVLTEVRDTDVRIQSLKAF